MNNDSLNQRFGIAGKISFVEGKGALPSILVNTPHSSAEISLHGAHLLSFKPHDQQDLVWMSERSVFENGKAIRGGIPVCFPWFGPHASDKEKPQHGFARLQPWQVKKVEDENDSISVTMELTENSESLALWPHPFKAVIEFVIGSALGVKLTVTNTGTSTFEYTDALHTYFNISSIDSISVEGLQDATFYEGFDMNLKTQQPPLLRFNTETNRRYVNTTNDCIIDDPGYQRKIRVSKDGSKVTVVWNPGEDVAKTIGDMTDDGYQTFVCVEPANAYQGIDVISLAPGDQHTLSTSVALIS